MKKTAFVIATLVTFSATAATAPAEARGLHVGRAATSAAVAAAVAAGVAASAYGYGYGYHNPGYVAYAAPYAYRGWAPY